MLIICLWLFSTGHRGRSAHARLQLHTNFLHAGPPNNSFSVEKCGTAAELLTLPSLAVIRTLSICRSQAQAVDMARLPAILYIIFSSIPL